MTPIRFSQLCQFTDKQWLATETADSHRYTLFGGSRGPGKSYWLRWYPIRQLLRWSAQGLAGVHWGLFCNTYPELVDRQISKIQTEFPTWLGSLHENRRSGLGFYLHPEYGSGALLLRNLDDPDKYKSVEFAGICIDELTRTPKSTFDILRGSLRWPGLDRTQFCAATNPDGRYSAWVRQLWIEHNLTGPGFEELAPLTHEFAFVPAFPTDNPYLSSHYWEDLRTAPLHLQAAWVDGNWYIPHQGLVYAGLTDTNVTDQEPDPEQDVELAFDDGYIDPRAILFIQRTRTHILVFDEIYHRRHLAETCVTECVDRCRTSFGRLPRLAVGDPSSIELRERLRKAQIPAHGEKVGIVEGINLVRRLVCDGNGHRTLQVHRRCINLLSELREGYQYSENSQRDDEIPLDANNHACDALRYWCWARARQPEPAPAIVIPGRDPLTEIDY